ncbi:MAG: hypothetical protein ACOZB0_10405 [Pseudomonadota bacterium]
MRRFIIALSLLTGSALAGDPSIPPGPPLETLRPRHIQYWDPALADLRVYSSYPSVTFHEGRPTLWHTGHTWTGPNGLDMDVDRFTRQTGPRLDALGAPETLARLTDLIDDVFDPAQPDRLARQRSLSRAHVIHDPELGYVGLVSVYPEFGVYLRPALITSKTGEPGTWRYLGQLPGDPAEAAARQVIYSDGGGLFRTKDQRWRLYLNGYAEGALSILEADTLAGPWRPLRDATGAPRLIKVEPGPDPILFPHLLRVSDSEWHLWLCNRWIPTEIWHYVSDNGLDFKPYGTQPEIVRGPDQPGFKGLRAHVSADGTRIIGLLPIWDESVRPAEWRLYATSMPVGLAPTGLPAR